MKFLYINGLHPVLVIMFESAQEICGGLWNETYNEISIITSDSVLYGGMC